MKSIKKETILVIVLVIIGTLIRVIGISNYPNALNVDEASSGYEAYSLLTNGIDRNGNTLPVFFQSWGSGQNALYSYLSIPFIAIFGLNTFSIRLPMALIGSISLIVFYLLLKRILDEKKAIVGLIFLIICPWHIMKSRWGLEANIFPDLILLFVYFLVKGIQDKKKVLYYLSFAIAGLSAYAYGTSYLFLPLFILPILIVLKIKQEIEVKEFIIALLITALVSLPIILFVVINTFNLDTMHIWKFTIPHLVSNRYKLVTSVFSGSFIASSLFNIKETFKIIIFQTDGLYWNSIKNFGTIYLFSTIFTLIGIITPIIDMIISKKKKASNNKVLARENVFPDDPTYKWIFAVWLIVAIIVGTICEPNINRLNILMFPIIYFTVIGICFFVDYKKAYGIATLIIYLIYFGLFIPTYLRQDSNSFFTFESGLKEVFEYVDQVNKTDDACFVISRSIKEPYIYTLFYTKHNSKDFASTVKYYEETEKSEYRQVKSFGNYYYGLNSDYPEDKELIFVFKKDDLNSIEYDGFEVIEINNYCILREKESTTN